MTTTGQTIFQTGLPASGTLTLQRCGQCEHINYPARELCGNCLADALQWHPVPATGTVQSLSRLDYSLEPAYAAHLPWTVASVALHCGPIVLAHLAPDLDIGATAIVRVIQDQAGNRMLLATTGEAATRQTTAQWLQTVGFKEISA
jgi:uncharacterized OB-fold protein